MSYRRIQSLIRRSGTWVKPIKDRKGFNPNQEFIDDALKKFLKKGGKVIELEPGPEYRLPIQTGSLVQEIRKGL